MSQEAVERILGRMITDERFRTLAFESLEAANLQEGYRLTPMELQLMSKLELKLIVELSRSIDSGLCRA
jgi:hypothetical protein